MPYENVHAARVEMPDKFEKDSFRSKEIAPGITIIVGKMMGSDSMVAQSYRFDAEKFTPDQAKEWLKEHHVEMMGFEPAKTIQSSLTDSPKIDNGVWITIVKDGTMAFNNVGKKFILTKSALDQDWSTWKNATVSINHTFKETGKFSEVKRQGEFVLGKPEGLTPEAIEVINSTAFRGVSQESIPKEVDEQGNVLRLQGTGVTLMIYPEVPACPREAGCGLVVKSLEPDSNFSLNTDISNSQIKSTGGTKTTMAGEEVGADALKSVTAERDALKVKVNALTSEMNTLKSSIPDPEKRIEERIKEINAANLLVIKSALDARDAEYAKKEADKIERDALINELRSYVPAASLDKTLATNPTNQVLRSNLEFVKSLGVSMPGVGNGEEIRSANLSGLKQFEAGKEIYEKLGLTEKDFITHGGK